MQVFYKCTQNNSYEWSYLSQSKVLWSPNGDLIATYEVDVVGHAKQ